MLRKSALALVLVLALVSFACSLSGTATPAVPPTSMPATQAATTEAPTASFTPFPSFTPSPPATDTPVPISTVAPVPTDTIVPVPTPDASQYIDDRSIPSRVIVSLYNAINRQEYLRAYNYWLNPAVSLGSYTAYASGYSNTASVGLVFGQITGDAGMSQVYYTVPVILKATARNGTRTNFAACYIVHATQPAVFGAPPFSPMGIDRGQAKASALNVSDSTALLTACDGYPLGPNPVLDNPPTLNIDKTNFVDNRSGPVETISSFLNSLNLKQYVRAYSYFQNPGSYPGPYDPFAAGYAGTDVIKVVFGTFQSEGAAGSLYYKLPLAMHVTTTSSLKQTFVGCYTLRLSQPAVQGTPPFQPMGIIAGKFTQVPNGTDVNPLLPTACN
jgi:hypothetical protein